MSGITSFGAYIPFYRLTHKDIAKAWGARAGEGERAVANVDEDSITMAVEAVRDCSRAAMAARWMGLCSPRPLRPTARKRRRR